MLVTDFDAPTGGVQKNSRLLLREFGKRGIGTFVCCRNYHGLSRLETREDGSRVRRSPVIGTSMAVNAIVYLIDTFFWLILNRKKYDVIHCQQMFGPTMAAAAASFVIRKPIVTRITLSGETGEAQAVRKMRFAGVRLSLLGRVTKWVTLTREMKGEIESLGVAPEKVKIIYNATEIPEDSAADEQTKIEYRKKIELSHSMVAVFTGRLSHEKGLDILLDAWKTVTQKFPEAYLILLGGGGDYRNVEAQLKQQVETFGIGNTVEFRGYVDNPKDYILASDVFVLPSRAEGMSNSLVEAMACGATIVATNIPANTEICEDGVNSLLVGVDDAKALAEALLKIFGDPSLAKELAQRARKKAENELSIETMIDAYIDTYSETIARRK